MRATAQSPQYPEFDEDGLLCDPAQWNEALAQTIAHREGVGELGEAHWKVIHSLRQHYARFGAAPAMIQICRLHGYPKNWVHDLFHTCLNAWRVAGLPNPGEEAKTYLSDM
jgi:TusE/DsrC/DsvC family sulfur relay protein